MTRRLRFGVIGCGNFAPHFTPYIREVADVVAVCDPNASGRRQLLEALQADLPEYGDAQSLMDNEALDAVAILSANHTHRDITLAAACRGVHVFCEKAMATSVPECWDMIRACEQAGVRLMVGHKRRLRPPWARMIELRAELGPVAAISSIQYFDARPYDFQGWWRRAAACGGLLDVADVHIVDWTMAMCGPIRRVRAVAAPRIDRRYDYPDTMHVEFEFHSSAVASLTASLSYPMLKFREAGGPHVICERGGMRFVPFLDHIDLSWQRFADAEPTHERFDDLGFQHAFSLEIGDFVRWIVEGREPCLTWREGLRCVEAMEAAHRSAAEDGALVTLPLYPELES